ncbi:carbamoyltransferase HypF [soil metagenome]
MVERRVIAVEGIVQGVGFRPFVFGLARRLELRGHVRNDLSGVVIDVEGDCAALDDFVAALSASPPRLAAVERVRCEIRPLSRFRGFSIAPSDATRGAAAAASGVSIATVAPDAATCEACLHELFDRTGRRSGYPFVTCTACGPRLTIALAAPYDRARTTMAPFALCAPCLAEYTHPLDRRFHAESLACPACGPRLEWRGPGTDAPPTADALAACAAALRAGQIVALKGIGGFQLVCDATAEAAVTRLRRRKRREAKPFAVMVQDLSTARSLCHVDDAEAALLGSIAGPIVLLRRRADAHVAAAVAPGMPTLGVMLPYTPLHHLLLRATGPLVVTSGNVSEEPIVTDNAEALGVLSGVADAFLLHDRAIAIRCDDSVAAVVAGAPQLLRRARGYVPGSLSLPVAAPAPLVALGGHLKNTFCLVRGRTAHLSQHIGDLDSAAARQSLLQTVAHFAALFDAAPRLAAHDLHPDYATTGLAAELGVERSFAVQHHHAHIASCLAEHGIDEPVIGIAFDGSGLGPDGAIWGGEFLLVEGVTCQRFAHFAYVPLPGGDAAVRHPWRTAVAFLHAAYGGELDSCIDLPPFKAAPAAELSLVRQLLLRGVRSPPTSSAGRLFDAVASIAGIRHHARFEAHAAIELEAAAGDAPAGCYPVDFTAAGDGWTIETAPIVRGVVADVRAGRPLHETAARFHATMCATIVRGAIRVRGCTGVRRVALSGGTFQNRRLTADAARALAGEGFDVLLHRRVPCNDGGLSLGQASIAARLASRN